MSQEPDPRAEIYDDLQRNQMQSQERQNFHSAMRLLGMTKELIPVGSVLDVGCGLGTWLSAALSLGVGEIFGIEGPWLDRSVLPFDPDLVKTVDLESRFSLGRRFDLAVCLEVAEHLSAEAAPRFVSSLVEHSDHVLFSAAIPGQGGHHHVNEQFLDYWEGLFAGHGFTPVDVFRRQIWRDHSILWWLRQNIVLFCRESAVAGNDRLRLAGKEAGPLSVVHPEIYASRMRQAAEIQQQWQAVLNLIGQGGTFEATRLPDGRLNLRRV